MALSETLSVVALTDATRTRWDEFVRELPQATFFHLAGWRDVLERACGHRTHYLMVERGGSIEGVLPLAEVRSRLFGHALISTPFCVYGGVAAATAAAREALENEAAQLAKRLGVDYLELRNITASRADWRKKNLYVTFRKPISADDEENMTAIPRKQRAMVRQGIKAGLVGEIDVGVDRFYRAYSESVRNLGTPVMSRRYFAILREVFGDACEVLTITQKGALVSSVMMFYFRDEVLPYYGGGTALAHGKNAGNDFMYWDLMCRAARRGVRVFDYGRSKRDTGSYHFKRHWGFEETPLEYQYYLVKSREIPNLSPTNPSYRMLIATWRRLPLPIANALGPIVARHLG
jgi:FemAB-related protein (PEP-CTERM system-associated)